MHSSVITGLIRTMLVSTCVCIFTSCAAPLPRLDDYSRSDSRGISKTPHPRTWNISENGDLHETISLLLRNPDPVVREHALNANRMLDELSQQRVSRVSEILEHESDELILAYDWSVEGDEEDDVPQGLDPVSVRRRFIEDAISAERSGEFALANKLASVAMSMEWIVDDESMMHDILERPMTIASRNNDRMKNIRLVDPKLAMRMSDPDGVRDGLDDDDSRTVDTHETDLDTRHRMMNTARAIEYFEELHVDEIDREVIHKAGLEELVLVTGTLIEKGHPIPDVYLEFIERTLSELEGEKTLELLFQLDSAQYELAAGTLPASFTMRVFGDGAAGALDRQTSVIWPKEFEQYTKSSGLGYRGIGVQIKDDVDGSIILRPSNGGPAKQSGVRDGDVLLEVEGVHIDEVGARGLAEVIDEPGRERIELLVRHEDDTTESIVVQLGPVTNLNVTGWRQLGLNEEGQPTWWWLADDRKRIGYLRLQRFASGGARAVRKALQAAQRQALSVGGRMEGLILDLRMNPGGQVVVAEEIINLFMGEGPIFRSIGRDGHMETEYADVSHSELEGLPLVILVDELSASASEVVAGLLKMNDKAIILGERTFGKGSIQGLVTASSKDCLVRVTIGWYQIPTRKGSLMDWRFVDRDTSPGNWGVKPDIRISTSAEQTREILNARSMWYSGIGTDVATSEALEILDPATKLALSLLSARINDDGQ